MIFRLEDFQERAVQRLSSQVAKARRDYAEDRDRTAVGLTAPTGAGKTVIATALLERLYFGDGNTEPDTSLTVLWVTDDPALNAQTINKISQASERINAFRFRRLGDTDESTLEPGYIYFVHIQQLSRNSTLHSVRNGTRSDSRTHGAWDMIATTVRKRGKDFVVVVDEAHRGASSNADRRTIVGTIVNGGVTNVGTQQPPAPVVLGISATPERFQQAMASAGRTLRTVEVPPSDVRSSGLLKDRILINHIAENQSANNTLLELAVADLKASNAAWQEHHAATGDRLVEPLLVIQVEPRVTDTRIAEILAILESGWSELSDIAVAHSFGEPKGPISVGGRTIRHLAPEAIEGDDRARVVLFKQALTTGWDCPRAEVLVSYANRDSYTDIAQLIGRLVRTPLAKRVDGIDRLNEVVAYLPGFNGEHVARVVGALTSDDAGEPPIAVVLTQVQCPRDPGVPSEVFTLLDTLPSYTRPRTGFRSYTAQLLALAAALNEHGLVPAASGIARQWLVNQMRAAVDAREAAVKEVETGNRDVQLGTILIALDEKVEKERIVTTVATAERDLDVYFARAKRILPDATASWYYSDLCDTQGFDDADAMVRVAAMASLGFKDIIEDQARAQIETWRSAYAGAVARKPRAVRDAIEPLWYLGRTAMVPTTVEAPEVYSAGTERILNGDVEPIDTYPKQLYVIPAGRPNAGRFPVVASGWEKEVLAIELDAEGLVGWYRNPTSGRNALAVPYEYGDRTLLHHPDFLFFHDDSGVVIDIVDPHQHNDAATSARWSALAQYAEDHPTNLRRVLAVIRDCEGRMRSLDLTASGMRDWLIDATDQAMIEALFDQRGADY